MDHRKMALNQEQVLLLQLHKLEKAGRYQEAANAYQTLLSQYPGHPFLLWGLGRCLMHFGRRHSAAKCFQQAVAALPSHPELTEDVVQRLILVGHPQEALRLCEQARARFPSRLALELHRVDALRLLNRHDEAIPVMRRMLQAPDPPAGAALRLIACLRQTGDARGALQLAAETLRGYAGDLLDKAGILNEMAHAQESLGDYHAAFQSLCTSGEVAGMAQQVQAVDATVYPRLLRNLHASIVTHGLPAAPAFSGGHRPRLVFQLGFPRSGTTLVESVMASDARIETSDEVPLWSAALAVLLEAGLRPDTMLEDIPRQPIALLERARKAYWDMVTAEFGSEFDLFVDKQPMNTIYLAHIRLLFPEAKIVFCERDPRDVCLSCFFQWFTINASNKHFLDWQETALFYRQVMDYWLTLRPLLGGAVYTLRYEKFVDDFADESKKLFQFLDLSWDPRVLTFHETNRERYFHTPSNPAIRRGVAAKAAPRWHRYPDAIADVQPVLEPIIRQLGY
jgi:tetratricopeptide (TPR) repeat protein